MNLTKQDLTATFYRGDKDSFSIQSLYLHFSRHQPSLMIMACVSSLIMKNEDMVKSLFKELFSNMDQIRYNGQFYQ